MNIKQIIKPTFFTSVTHILLVSFLSLFPQSSLNPPLSLSSLGYFTGEAGLPLSCNCVVVTLSSNNSQVEVSLQSQSSESVFRVSLQSHLNCALSHRSLLSSAITQSVISKSIGQSIDSVKPVGCYQATTFSNVKSLQYKGELA